MANARSRPQGPMDRMAALVGKVVVPGRPRFSATTKHGLQAAYKSLAAKRALHACCIPATGRGFLTNCRASKRLSSRSVGPPD